MYIGEKIQIFPDEENEKVFNEYIDYQRAIFNKSLEIWNKMWDTYKITKDKKNDFPNYAKVKKKVTYVKNNEWTLNRIYPSELINAAVDNLNEGYKKFFSNVSKNKPHFKSSKKAKRSFNFPRKLPTSISVDGKWLKLTRTKRVKLKHSMNYSGEIVKCTISNQGDYWFAGFTIKVDSFNVKPTNNNLVCGIDLGSRSLAILSGSDGFYKKYNKMGKRLSILYKKIDFYNKQMSRRYKKGKSYNQQSNRYKRARNKFNNTWVKIKAIKKNYIEKVTTNIVRRYQYIILEDLGISNMLKTGNASLSNSISHNSWYTFKTRIEEKAQKYGNTVILADRFYPSTQTCSRCGFVRKKKCKIGSKHRYHCLKCGLNIDRDFNAAENLKNYWKQ